MKTVSYLACDLGAESGRVMQGTVSGQGIVLNEAHRFPTSLVSIGGGLRWNLLRTYEEIKHGLKIAARSGESFGGISTDSWAVDYVYYSAAEPMLALPYSYRDARCQAAMEGVLREVSREEIFAATGLQFLNFNTIYQLWHDREHRSGLWQLAEGFLTIADYLNYLLGARACVDESFASSTQLYDPRTRQWATALIERLRYPLRLFPEIVPPGTITGALDAATQRECGLPAVPLITSCSHDTGAAVVGVPADEGEAGDWAFLSSGTWSLLGIEMPHPVITEACARHNFTNEAGFAGTTRLLKNIAGLWIVQECRRYWESRGESLNYDQITAAAAAAPALRSLINPNDARFIAPGEMPEKIAAFCRETEQPVPEGVGPVVRCALDSLALCYDAVLRTANEVAGKSVQRLHIVGGGGKNRLLNQMTANACGVPVIAGPTEATALGNLLVQAYATGQLGSLSEMRALLRRSFPTERYEPEASSQAAWQAARERFARLISN